MLTIQSLRRSTVMAGVLAAVLCGPSTALAQDDTAVRPRPAVQIGVALPQGGELPSFAIDMALRDGHLQGSIKPLEAGGRLDGRHSAIRFTEHGLRATFGTRLQQQVADAWRPRGEFTVEAQATGRPAGGSGGGGGGGDIVVFDILGAFPDPSTEESACPCGADIVVFDILGVEDRASEGQVDLSAFAGQTIRIRSEAADASTASLLGLDIEPASATEQLRCTPTYLCNTPGPGETLMVRVPWLAPGEALDLVLEIAPISSSGAGILIPIKVKHNV